MTLLSVLISQSVTENFSAVVVAKQIATIIVLSVTDPANYLANTTYLICSDVLALVNGILFHEFSN